MHVWRRPWNGKGSREVREVKDGFREEEAF